MTPKDEKLPVKAHANGQVTPWHALPLEEAFHRLDAHTDGLNDEEVDRRLQEYGPNRLRPPKTRGPLARFLQQFHNVLIYVLIAAGVVTALLGHWVDTAVIFGVVVINAIIGFIQEGKAERALESVRNMLSLHAVVIRNGHRSEIPAEQLVPGDVVELKSGDKVPADVRLFKIKNLQVQEAMLTGESVPVEKATPAVDEKASIGDRPSLAYSGTLVTSGQGRGLVVETGDTTEIGRIGTMLSEVETLTTPLLKKLATFGHWLTAIILILATVTFAFGVWVRDYEMTEMFLAAVSLAVAAIPEGLPAIMTITLAIGVQRMAGRNAIIRRLPAVETLGAVTTICSDKTGTLTRNEMTTQTIATAGQVYEVTGVGYEPSGSFTRDGSDINVDDHPVLTEILRAGLLCNDAVLRKSDGEWVMEGDPTEGALVTAARKAGLDHDFENEAFPRIDVIPFESEHRFMATLHHDHEGNGFIYVKGAPERLLEMCSRQRGHNEDEALNEAHWQQQSEEIASKGQRLLAVARRDAPHDKRDLRFEDVEKDLTLLGFCGLIDPPRREAIEAIEECQTAGIRVKMITGDHAITAGAIARELGLLGADKVLTGRDLDDLDDDSIRDMVPDTDVFARASPEHKLRLVKGLQAAGHVTAMTGDGVNDAPALKRADVGVAMGIKGTEAAKEASEMVLVDDNFASIAHAVEEGRTVYDNLRKSIIFILPTNGGQSFTIIAAILLGFALPLTAVQVLWVNMITAVTMALALAFEPTETGVMKRSPRPPDEPLLTGFLLWRILFVSVILVSGTFGLFLWAISEGMDEAAARTVAVNTLVVYQMFYLFNCRRLTEPVFGIEGIFGSRYILMAIAAAIVLQMLFTYAPPLQVMFGTRSIGIDEWGLIVLVTFPVFFLVEFEKWVLRRMQRSGGAG
jgi:magnesium-transporting ATPase (P-type)